MRTPSRRPAISEKERQFSGTLLRGEPVSWCDQGYASVDQDAVVWFYLAAFLFVILPYLIMSAKGFAKCAAWQDISVEILAGRKRLPR